MPLATLIGFWLNRKGVNLLLPSLISLVIMYGTVLYGNEDWLGTLNASMQSWNLITWVILLLVYSYVASVLPVWTLLQPLGDTSIPCS